MPYLINHVHIRSKDPHASARWYQKHFGARILEEVESLLGARTIRMAVAGDTRLYVSTQPQGKSLPRGTMESHLGLEHFGFDVPDLAKELERLKKEGVRIRLPMTTISDGMKLAFIEAPDDVLIELVEAR